MAPQKEIKQREWYKESVENALKFFNSSTRGLTSDRVSKNREIHGSNVISAKNRKTTFGIILDQFNSPLVYILVIATALVFFLGDFVNAGVILFIVILNAVIGTIQEGKARDTLGALQQVIKSYATVLRDGNKIIIEDIDLVPGDVIILKDGSVIPADVRLMESTELKVNQSALTGESEPVTKRTAIISGEDISFNEQQNMLFRGTYVISGLAKAVVVRAGSETVIGQISHKLGEIDAEVPLKRKIRRLSRVILFIVAFISAAILVVGISNGTPVLEMILIVVAIAVSAIPESLPVVVTLVLTAGVWRMSQKKVLVKRLQAVEALGQATVIAVDKTGTITKNQMTVGKVYVNNRNIDVDGAGYNIEGGLIEEGNNLDLEKKDEDLDLIGKISTFTSIADFDKSDSENWKLQMGDPTEAALSVFGSKLGMEKGDLEHEFPKILEIPFSIKTKFHATINQIGKKKMLSIAGGPEAILKKCTTIWEEGKKKQLSELDRKKLQVVIDEMSTEGYRILALAANFNPLKNTDEKNIPDLTFVGFVGIIDAIRPEVYDSVKRAHEANIKVVMITGDYHQTAQAIAHKVGIYKEGDLTLTGMEIDQLSDEALTDKIDKVTVFARVSPDNKLRIIEAFKRRKDVIAMTGDGINDALSLAAADLGVSMGDTGTEVAREASDLILLDDNFGNIIEAAEEGRHIYWIIRKSILYLLSTNVGELSVITIAVFAGMPIPLIATQIIWLNLVTDTFLVAALSLDPKEKDIMSDTYRRPGNSLFDKLMLSRIVLIGTVMTITTLYLFSNYAGGDMVKAWTISLTMLTVLQWYNIFNIRSHKNTIFSKEIFNNKYLLLGVAVAAGLHMFAIYTPFMQNILQTTGLNLKEWGIIMLLGSSVIVVEEIRKIIYRSYSRLSPVIPKVKEVVT